ncbi:MAG: phenylalanine--tRNA ligase beta subunit-related protein [Candidatus Diapherotrites archaeon]
MDFEIDSKIFENFPSLEIAVVYAQSCDNADKNELLSDELNKMEEITRVKFDLQTLVEEEKISVWRNAYSSFGAKPKTYKNSVEALIRRVLKGEDLPRINSIVDCYNLISLKYVFPCGADDADKVEGKINLAYSKGGEKFTRLNSDETSTLSEGEIAYMDEKEVLCRRWNWSECDKTKLTSETKNAVIVIESLTSNHEELKKAAEELEQLLKIHCSAKARIFYLNKGNKKTEIG